MELKPFFCYYGGKYRNAKHYPQPRYDKIVEPFAGAAGYSTRYANRKVRLYDLDPIICGLWSYLIAVKASEIRSLPTKVSHVEDLKTCQEAKWLVGFWLNKGCSKPMLTPSKWMRSEIRPNSYWGEAIRERIASQVTEIRHWRIWEASYDEVPDSEATWFVDPPYQSQAGKYYRYSRVNFKRLGRWCEGRAGQVIVCEQQGADWLPFRDLGSFKSLEGTNGRKRSKEMIWTN